MPLFETYTTGASRLFAMYASARATYDLSQVKTKKRERKKSQAFLHQNKEMGKYQ